jgi:hypothetical protein
MTTLEYVASGTAHTRILAIATLETPEVLEVIKSYFRHLNGLNDHKFSLLYNAFTEADFGPRFKEFYRDAIYTIHADSGGLQIVTQGKSITEELKDGVYLNQARNADIAMCFDEIPIGVVGGRSGRNDTDGRYFERAKLEEFARKTGRNIKRQIELFLDEKTASKPMLIAQGNDYESYMLWTQYVIDEIPSSYYKHIGGIALGAAALGTGIMEDIERAAYAPHLPFQMDTPYFHVLGVGSVRRLLPYLSLMRSGYYPKNTHLSYDSTTHTSGISIGLYYLNGGYPIDRTLYNPNGFVNQIYVELYADLNKQFDYEGKGIGMELYHKMLNSDSSFYHDRVRKYIDIEKMKLYYHAHTGFYSGAIANFTHDIKRCLRSERFLREIAVRNKVGKEVSALLQHTDLDSFLKWKTAHGSMTKGKRIKDAAPAQLDFSQWQ